MKKKISVGLSLLLFFAVIFGWDRMQTVHAAGSSGKISITNKSITPEQSPVDQYTNIKVDLDFSVPNDTQTGDQAVITLPQNLKFIKDQSFDVLSPDGSSVVAKAVIRASDKTITLTYTDYVSTKSDITGHLFFDVRVEAGTASPSKVPITLDVDNNPTPIGEVDFVVDPGDTKKILDKVSWGTESLAEGGITRQYEVRVNASGDTLRDTLVSDSLGTAGMSYVQGSFVIKKGKWVVNSQHKLELQNATTVDLPVTFGADQKSFQVQLGTVNQSEGYSIVYKVKISYTPANGESFLNNVVLKADKELQTKSNPFVYQTAGGEAVGYNYGVTIKKVDEANNSLALAGATFNVVRVATGEVVQTVTTDAQGLASVEGLLNADYQLVETKAPEGYELDATPIDIKPADFGTTKIAQKTVTNKAIVKEPTPTSAVIELSKTLSGRDLKDGEFSFELYEGRDKLQTATNKDGKVTFEAISYQSEGEHTYTIKEVVANVPGITYDTTEKQVTIKVTREGDSLKATVEYPNNTVFANIYTAPTPGSVQFKSQKILEGRDLVEGEFSFQLLDENGNVLQTKTNAADGSIVFDELTYTEADAGQTYTYTIKEVIPENKAKGVTYDEENITVTVAVSKDQANHAIKAVASYGDKKTFTNTVVTTEIPPTPPTVEKPELKLYNVQLHKVDNKGNALAGAVFGLFEADGTTPVANPYGEGQATATSDAEGLITFTGVEAKDYIIKELTAPAGYQLTTEVISVTAAELEAATDQLVDKGNIVNEQIPAIPPKETTPPPSSKKVLPKTGATSNDALVFSGLVGMVLGFFLLRKKELH
ncbi:SpaA isopeptide-forming pilin-related protein [Streptococcus sp. DD13]|uniref:SpaA isopeptide-forming pilin-related protein n=1 Tax=Streptococcus sp. DD13 TaxID=1777881 RepID=UPI000791F2ED|nr:SpaA isopeptide-forming pilin-related protein [Streptococcus sp. DD13]KXT77589.1 cell wall surface anchor family protein [Streptococcus sp. DD13]